MRNLKDGIELEKELDALIMGRQWVITQARKNKISSEDMDYQLSSLALQEMTFKRELANFDHLNDVISLDNSEEKAREYLADLLLGLESINAAPQTDEVSGANNSN